MRTMDMEQKRVSTWNDVPTQNIRSVQSKMSRMEKVSGNLRAVACTVVPLQHPVDERPVGAAEEGVGVAQLQQPGPEALPCHSRRRTAQFVEGEIYQTIRSDKVRVQQCITNTKHWCI